MKPVRFDVCAGGRPALVRPEVQGVLALLVPAMAIRGSRDALPLIARLATTPGISFAHLDQAPARGRSRAVTELLWPIDTGSTRQWLCVGTTGAAADEALLAALDAFAAVLGERLRKAGDHDYIPAVCHALRGSLTSLTAFAGFLTDAEEGELSDEHRQFAEIIGRSSERMLTVVDELALLTRLESGEPKLNLAPVSIPELVRTVVAEQQPCSRSAAAKLRSECVDGPSLSSDRVQLHQMLTSLVVNRLEVATPGGSVDLRAAPTSAGWQIDLTVPGDPDEELDRLFTAFHQPSRSPSPGTPGSGLSLAVSRAIAESHGGTIRAEHQGAGTTVSVGLPWRRPGEPR